MTIWTAWVREAQPSEGWVAYDVEAPTHAEAVAKARWDHGAFAQVDEVPKAQQRAVRVK